MRHRSRLEGLERRVFALAQQPGPCEACGGPIPWWGQRPIIDLLEDGSRLPRHPFCGSCKQTVDEDGQGLGKAGGFYSPMSPPMVLVLEGCRR